jgi:hypothetical protein
MLHDVANNPIVKLPVRHIFSRRAHFDSYFPAVGIGETGLPRRRFESSTGVIRYSLDSQAIRYTPWLRLRV